MKRGQKGRGLTLHSHGMTADKSKLRSTSACVQECVARVCVCEQGQVYWHELPRELAMNRADGRSIPIWRQRG